MLPHLVGDQLLKVGNVGEKITMKHIYDWMKTCTPEQLKGFVAASPHKPMHGTVGVSDCLYLPAGWAYYEKVSGADTVSLRIKALTVKHMKAP